MKKRRLGSSDIFISPLGLGTLTIGSQLKCPLKEGAMVVKYALKKGVNFIDTAQSYGTYAYVRKALDDMREAADFEMPVISTKTRAVSYEDAENAVRECLEALSTEKVDIFLLHEVREAPDFKRRAGAWKCLLECREKGMIGAVGVSTHHVDVVEKMASVKECDVVFPLINYAGLGIRRGGEPGTAAEMAAAIASCAGAGKGIFAMKAFGGGNLSGDYVKALNYVTSVDGVDSVMMGMGTREEVDTAVAYFEKRLPESFKPDVSRKKIHIDGCEKCGACIEACPNRAIFRNREGFAEVKREICLTCGYCAPVCPVRAIVLF